MAAIATPERLEGAERMEGIDALLWHMEHPDTPLHTLKVVILDPSRRGKPITLVELATAVAYRLGFVPRGTQKVVAPGPFGGRPFWVDDPDFSVGAHVTECRLPSPGGPRELDALYSRLATEHLPADRPPWAMTLVHGLAGGRQAVVTQIHHASTDGMGALNAFLACTSDERSDRSRLAAVPVGEGVDDRRLISAARSEIVGAALGFPALLRDAVRNRRLARRFRAEHPEVPPFIGARRNFANAPSGGDRSCASHSLDFELVRQVSKAAGTTVNGVLHAVIAGAMRTELLERGEDVSSPTVATFGVAADTQDADRRVGNKISPVTASLYSNLADPLERLEATARSCAASVELRRRAGVGMTERWATYTPRLGPTFRRLFADHLPRVVSHVVTANVAGPRTTRWIGDVEIVDWVSFAVAVNPSNINITVYSYAGRMNIGLVTTPEALPEPHRFLERMTAELDLLVERTSALESADLASTS